MSVERIPPPSWCRCNGDKICERHRELGVGISTDILTDVAVMMSEFVDNWPNPQQDTPND